MVSAISARRGILRHRSLKAGARRRMNPQMRRLPSAMISCETGKQPGREHFPALCAKNMEKDAIHTDGVLSSF